MTLGDERRSARIATAFSALGPGSVGLVLDSQGMYALAMDQRSAARELRLATGDEVLLSRPTPTSRDAPTGRGPRRAPPPEP